jgi:hypothetical protein
VIQVDILTGFAQIRGARQAGGGHELVMEVVRSSGLHTPSRLIESSTLRVPIVVLSGRERVQEAGVTVVHGEWVRMEEGGSNKRMGSDRH